MVSRGRSGAADSGEKGCRQERIWRVRLKHRYRQAYLQVGWGWEWGHGLCTKRSRYPEGQIYTPTPEGQSPNIPLTDSQTLRGTGTGTSPSPSGAFWAGVLGLWVSWMKVGGTALA